jgi:hypothetical protein
MKKRWLLMPLLALLAAACATTGEEYPSEPPGRVIKAPPRESVPGEQLPPVPSSIPQGVPQSAEEASGPAVKSLVLQARAQISSNHPEQALPLLEHASRIESRNPFVLQMLATTHLALGHTEDAENFAEKSNSSAHGNPYVEIENWKVLAATRQAAGDADGALRAQTRVDQLKRLLGQ